MILPAHQTARKVNTHDDYVHILFQILGSEKEVIRIIILFVLCIFFFFFCNFYGLSTESGGPSATASAPSLVIPQAVLDQIVGIVEEMGKNEMITPAAEEILRDLVRKQDSRVISAFKTYVQVRDGADLIDSLLRIAAYETAQQKSSSSATTSKSSGSSNGKPSSSSSGSNSASVSSNGKQSAAAQEEQADDEGEDESDAVSLLSAEDQKTVVQILLR